MAVRTRKHKVVRESLTTGYIVEDFDAVSNGYGNLTGKQLTACQAIRHYCWTCCGGHEFDWRLNDGSIEVKCRPYDEVRECASTTCYLYPFRSGRNPNKAHLPGNSGALSRHRAQESG